MDLEKRIKRYEERSYSTYKSRLTAHQRLRRQNTCWNISVITTNFLLISISLIISTDSALNIDEALKNNLNILVLIFSILSLVLSLVQINIQYPQKIEDMKKSYLDMQEISCDFEDLQTRKSEIEAEQEFIKLKEKYSNLIKSSTNHTPRDYKIYLNSTPESNHQPTVWSKRKFIAGLYKSIDLYPLIFPFFPLVGLIMIK